MASARYPDAERRGRRSTGLVDDLSQRRRPDALLRRAGQLQHRRRSWEC